ncbi:hypothetical protein GEV33_012727 [Tenebrio molitor]|uniref:Protein FAM177A1 n=1 Tax=Tenebrio molitor TaxID=7067 RepID=A0A8J6H992_TENMO|nr:hypothetical protein GEV33_012727 [Tenebrio molitor]
MVLINPDEYKNTGAVSDQHAAVKMRTPKRILHFSDGVLEEYSDDEFDNTPKEEEQAVVDPRTLTWGPWIWYKTWRAGAGTLAVVDTVGEFLAAFFGITTPKYYFELEEYKKKEEELKAEKEQRQGWSEASAAETLTMGEITTKQPQPVEGNYPDAEAPPDQWQAGHRATLVLLPIDSRARMRPAGHWPAGRPSTATGKGEGEDRTGPRAPRAQRSKDANSRNTSYYGTDKITRDSDQPFVALEDCHHQMHETKVPGKILSVLRDLINFVQTLKIEFSRVEQLQRAPTRQLDWKNAVSV